MRSSCCSYHRKCSKSLLATQLCTRRRGYYPHSGLVARLSHRFVYTLSAEEKKAHSGLNILCSVRRLRQNILYLRGWRHLANEFKNENASIADKQEIRQ